MKEHAVAERWQSARPVVGARGADAESGSAGSLGQRIRTERERQGRSIRDVAGGQLSPSLISRVERDLVVPSLHTLQYLADRLDRSVAYLLTGQDGGDSLGRKRPKAILEPIATLLNVAGERGRSPSGSPVGGHTDGVAPPDLVALLTAAIHEVRNATGSSAPCELASLGLERTEPNQAASSALSAFFTTAAQRMCLAARTARGDAKVARRVSTGPQPATMEARLLLNVPALNLQLERPDEPPPTLAGVVRERAGAAYKDLVDSYARGDLANALLAAGWGLGLLEMELTVQAWIDHSIAQTGRQGVTEAAVLAIERQAEASGYEPEVWTVTTLAEEALERHELTLCDRLLALASGGRSRPSPLVTRVRARLAFDRGDLGTAVEQWETLADDPDAPASLRIATLMQGGMMLDEAQHPHEAQLMYRRAAYLWQQIGPRSPITSDMFEPIADMRG